jgi:hypothetical protein
MSRFCVAMNVHRPCSGVPRTEQSTLVLARFAAGWVFAIGTLLVIPIGLVIWATYVWRKWRGGWRYWALLTAFVIAADVLMALASGGYAAGVIAGLHWAAGLLAFVIAGIHRGHEILEAGAKRSRR